MDGSRGRTGHDTMRQTPRLILSVCRDYFEAVIYSPCLTRSPSNISNPSKSWRTWNLVWSTCSLGRTGQERATYWKHLAFSLPRRTDGWMMSHCSDEVCVPERHL